MISKSPAQEVEKVSEKHKDLFLGIGASLAFASVVTLFWAPATWVIWTSLSCGLGAAIFAGTVIRWR